MDETGPSRGNALRMSEIMENGDSCGSSDVMEGEDSAASVGIERPHSVLWERVIQQTILIDLGEDESLHFSDLPGTLNVCQSQDLAPETSFHLCENLDDYDTHKGTQDEDPFSGSSLLDNRRCNPMDGAQEGLFQGDGAQSSEIRVSAQRPNTKEASLAHKYEEAGNTSDEDQEDLPYDGDLNHDLGGTTGKPDGDIINQSARESGLECKSPAQSSILDSVSVNRVHVDNTSPSLVLEQANEIYYPSARESHSTDSRTGVIEGGEDVPEVFGHTTPTAAIGLCQPVDAAAQSNIKELLVQHFIPHELLDPNFYIEAETLPELSFADSADETILSKTLSSLKLGTDISVSQGGNNKLRQEGEMKAFGEGKLRAKESQGSKDMPPTGSDAVLSPVEEFMEYDGGVSSIQGKNGVQIHSSLLERAQSFNELKYGQGQVHYPLPDFSKVASKIKIPKASAAKPPCHQPGILRAQSSPGMLGKSLSSCKATMDVINKVLEDTIQPSEAPYIFSEQPKHCEESPKSTELVQHLQAEYDKLLTKYAEAENLIDQMRLGSKTQGPVDPVALEGQDILEVQVLENTAHQRDLPPKHPHPKGYPEDLGDPHDDSCPTQTNQMRISEGEKMTTELLEIISQYTQKVDDFQNCLSLMSIGINEQQMVFKTLMDALDQLERNYIAKKDEHRALEMQNYMGLSRNTGEFDPERKVEGEIFKISMRLEDIRELIGKNIRNQISPPASCSTPAPSLPLDASPSPPPSACEELLSSSQNVGTEEDSAELSHILTFVPQTHDDPASITQCSGHTSTSPDHSDTSLERLGFGRCEEEEEEEERADKSVESVHRGTYLPSQSVTPPTPLEKSQRSESVLPWGCDGSAPHYPVTQTQGILPQAQSVSQRIVTHETDSGFGGSNLNLPAAEQTPFQSETERSRLYSEEHSSPINTSGSDSDASYSAMQMTTVQNVSSWKHNEGPQLTANTDHKTYASERAISAAAGGQSHTSRQHVYCAGDDFPVPPPETLSFSSDWRRRHSAPTDAKSHLCSCHSEAISALQLEVARLKQEVKESLFQLPHITKRMDYLTSRYDQVKRPKAKPRAHLRGSSSSGLRHSGYRHRKETMSTDSNLSKAEDWISSDLEPKSETGDPLLSMRLQHSGTFHQAGEGRDGWPRPCTEKRLRPHSARLESTEDMETSHSEARPFLNVVKPLQKPLLQVNYSSSYSLPAGFKAMEPQSAGQHRKRSTQSDSALLPSNVYFLRPQCTPQTSRSSRSSSSYRRSQDEYISRTLDRAIEAAQSMKRRTDRMARSLSADLGKAELHGKLCHPYPGRHRENPDS